MRALALPPLFGLSSRQELALMAITALWAGTLFVVQEGLRHCGPLFFVGLRFVAAGLIVAVVCRRHMRGWTRQEVVAGTAIGSTIFLAYALQTAGIQTITPSQLAFITSMYVPAVPLLQWLMLGKAPHPMSGVGIVAAFAGLVALTNPDPHNLLGLGTGELLTLGGAALVAVEIVLISRFAPGVSHERVTMLQLLSAGLMSWLSMPVMAEPLPDFSWVWLASGVAMGAISAVMQGVMNWAQRDVSPTRATLIYASGPLWGGIFGWLMGEHLTGMGITGALLIAGGMVLSEWRPKGR